MKKFAIIFTCASIMYGCGGDKTTDQENNSEQNDSLATDSNEDMFEGSSSEGSELGSPSVALNSNDEKLSYCFGFQSSAGMKKQLNNANYNALVAGFNDFQSGKPKFSVEAADEMLKGYFQSGEAQKDSSLSRNTEALETKKDSVCYSFGVFYGNAINKNFDWIDNDIFLAGLKDRAFDVNKIDDQELIMVQQKLYGVKMSEKGAAFLAENKKRSEVVELPSGLQYEIITKGNGPKPKASEKVKVHYHGTLIDGTVFDSSVDRGEPATFGVTQVIPGWVEGLQLMPVGSKWKLYIPYNLAYGERGSPPKIAPYSALVFEVELLSIEN